MMIMKRALPRRTFLRGVGCAVALPFLDAMVPALSPTAKAASKAVPRLGFFYVPNGVETTAWHPKAVGTNFEFPPILRPLEPYRDRVVVVSGLSNLAAEQFGIGAGPHTRSHAAWLSGVRAKRTEGADIECGTTIDQLAAMKLGEETALPSLELTLESGFEHGNCDNGYACAYINSTSWRTATTPLPMEENPRAVFERLFGDGGSAAARLAQMKADRSILNIVTKDMARLRQTLGPTDRTVLNEYLDTVRDVERRIQKAEQHSATSPIPAVQQPFGVPDTYEDYIKLMFDLQFLAYQADITRVVTFQIGREQSARSYPQIGVSYAHHALTHSHVPEQPVLQEKINTYHVSLFAHLVDRMRTTPDGDGTLLDHAMLLYGSGMSIGDIHSPHDLPLVLVGGGCGQLKGGRHLQYAVDTPMMNLGLSLLDKVGVNVEKLGDSTGVLADL
jgi:hypothetical protein